MGLALVEGDELWVGNFGDGLINNYDPVSGNFIEALMRADGTPLQFDGLWDLLPLGDGVYRTAGIADEEHGLFGIITEDQNRRYNMSTRAPLIIPTPTTTRAV